jgi:hypothetical protein
MRLNYGRHHQTAKGLVGQFDRTEIEKVSNLEDLEERNLEASKQ